MNEQLNAALSALSVVGTQANNLNNALHDAISQINAAANIPLPPPVLRIIPHELANEKNATTVLQSFLDGQGVIYLPAGQYSIDPRGINARSRTVFVMAAGATLTAIPNSFEKFDILRAEDGQDITIVGGTIFGDRLTHDYSSGGTHEWGMGLRLRRCKRVLVRDLIVRNCTGDGITASGVDLTFDHVESDMNRRQGMSLYSGSRYHVYGGVYGNTGNIKAADGTITSPGAKPMAGIDIEPDEGDVTDVVIEQARILNNGTSGVLAVSRTDAASTLTGLVVRDNYFEGNANDVQAQSPSGKSVSLSIIGNTFKRTRSGSGVRLDNTGSWAQIGAYGNADEANTFISTSPRVEKRAAGMATQYDIMLFDGAAAAIGDNIYRGP